MAVQPGRKPHVLTLIDLVGPGGAEVVAEELMLGIDPDRFRRSVCITRNSPPEIELQTEQSERRIADAGVQVFRLNRSTRLDLWSMVRLWKLLRSTDVDVVHAHKFGSNAWAAIVGRLARVPVIVAHEHGWAFDGSFVRMVVNRYVLGGLCDAVIAVSEVDRSRMVHEVKMPSRRVRLIPNGIRDASGGDGRRIRREFGIADHAPVLVQTAVLRPEKAIEVVLEAMALLIARHPDVHLMLVGPGDPSELTALASRLGVADAVTFTGSRSDVPDLLAAADIGLLTSDREGMPLAVLEYMAAGLPVVATDVGGLPEVVVAGDTGFLVPRRDSAMLAARITELLENPSLARSMGERGRERQRAEFSRETMLRRVTELYDELLDARGVTVRTRERAAAAN